MFHLCFFLTVTSNPPVSPLKLCQEAGWHKIGRGKALASEVADCVVTRIEDSTFIGDVVGTKTVENGGISWQKKTLSLNKGCN